MTERVRLTPAVNRLLWPRLRVLGFRFQFPEEGDAWRDGRSIIRVGSHGRQQGLQMGRDKFGHLFGINAARQRPDGKYDYLDIRLVGLSRSELSYRTQAEAEAVLERIAKVVATHVVPWLDEEPPTDALCAKPWYEKQVAVEQ